MERTVRPAKLGGTITPPCSKSYAQRALALALLAEGRTTLHNLDLCDDTRAALAAIGALGARIERLDAATITVEGALQYGRHAGTPCVLRPAADRIHAGESGLAARLFAPLAALADRPVRIEGEATLLHRPMLPMVGPLRRLGARAEASGEGVLPVTVCGPLRGGEAEIDGSVSSQFTTGLLLALPVCPEETTLRLRDAVSTPYLDMTIAAADRFGAAIFQRDYAEFYIPGGQRYRAADYAIEGDWSAAAMLLAAGAVAGQVTVSGISRLSKQADTRFCEALVRAGAVVVDEADAVTAVSRPLRAFEFDATDCPDLFPALVVLAAAAEGTSVLRGAARLQYKECNRRDALCEEYGRLGIAIRLADPDTMVVLGGPARGGRVSGHGDHRIAMSLAATALRAEAPVTVEGAECVAKSYPAFFEELERCTAGAK